MLRGIAGADEGGMDRGDHIAIFRGTGSDAPHSDDALLLPAWTEADWNKVFSRTRTCKVRASEVVIRRDAIDRSISFVRSNPPTPVIGSSSIAFTRDS